MLTFDFAALLEAMPDAVVVADMESRIVYANASVERVLGWPAGSLIGQHLHAIQPERLHEAHDRGFGRYASTGERTLFGTPVRLPALASDGSEHDVELNLAEITGPGGERLVLGVVRDLTERVELERGLRVLRNLKATSAAAAQLWTRLDPTLVLRTLTDVLVADFDSALARAWVYEAETNELVLKASAGLSTRVEESSRARIDVETYPYKVGAVARTGRGFLRNGLDGDPEFDQEWIAREGLRGIACLPLMSGGTLLGVMVHFSRLPIPPEVAETINHLAALASAALNDARLVEQERAARAEADRRRAHFELLAEVSEKLSSSLDPEVTVQMVADTVVPAFADWCIVDLVREDRTLETVASAHRDPGLVDRIRELRAAYPPMNRTPVHSIYRAMEGGKTIGETVSPEELARRAVDAAHLALLTELGIGSHVVATLTTGGQITGAVSLVRGPEREPFDDDDTATAEDIARRAAMATENARLYRSAEQAIEMRDRFLAVASHELRTPLSVVYGHWELLARWLRNDPDAASRPNADKIEVSVQRLGAGVDQLRRLVEELLDVSRLAHGTMDLRRAPVDLVAAVRQAVDDASASAAIGRLSLELPEGPLIGQWDAARLGQVLDNLLLNALKYSPGDRPVEVALTRLGGVARLSVTDAGIGIPPDEIESIFEPFSRAQNASAQHFPGLGLGLAVSREIVTRLGGRMWADSEGEGRGSSFFVELDLGDPGDPSPPAATDVGAQR
ncbi:MAG: PAS domain S-box protein [Chloroflexi bacterium]|nr:PAS domain S-box protein [Chloroflexota bacterium]